MNHFELILILFKFMLIASVSSSTVIQNFPVQKYQGAEDIEWGPWEYCPPGQYAVAFTARTDHGNEGDRADWSALNAVCLYCAPLYQSFDPKNSTKICSTQGRYGTWLKEPMACGFLIVGFKLNIDDNIRQPQYHDLLGAFSIKIICSGAGMAGKTMAVGYSSTTFEHIEGNEQKCLKGQAVCGIRTQVQPFRGDGKYEKDDTMLQNIRMKCCEVKPTSETCKPKDGWVLLQVCDNINGLEVLKCEFIHTIGMAMTKASKLTKSEMHAVMAEASVTLGVGGMAFGIGLKTEFTASVGGGLTSGYDWSKEDSQSFSKTVETTITVLVPQGTKTFIYQLVGTCGIYSVFASKLFRGDTKSRTASVKPYLVPDGFFCDSQSSDTMAPATDPGSKVFKKSTPFY